MKTEIAQMVSLTSFGNYYLTNHEFDLDMNHSTTEFCIKIEFIEFNEGTETPIAKNPMEWFEYLKTKGIKRLNLHFATEKGDRLDASFAGGGGRWIIEASKGELSDVWDVRWKTSTSKDKNRIWVVSYGITAQDVEIPHIIYPPIDFWHKKLTDELSILKDLTKNQSLDDFMKFFVEGLDLLESPEPMKKTSYHHDLVPPEIFPLKCKQIFAAVQKGWIVASINWIETYIEDDKQNGKKIKISDDLYDTMCRAIMVATNSSKFDLMGK